ncbi:MAG: 30S ribosome-binding factor RbfA [Spirochaetota bacterium]
MANVRLRRVESLLREEISSLILRNEIKDPRVDSMVSVSGVSVSKDLAYAKVRVSGFKERNELESAVHGLNHAAGFIQQRIGRKLKFRETPKLTFVTDHSIEDGFEINRTIDTSVSQPS